MSHFLFHTATKYNSLVLFGLPARSTVFLLNLNFCQRRECGADEGHGPVMRLLYPSSVYYDVEKKIQYNDATGLKIIHVKMNIHHKRFYGND